MTPQPPSTHWSVWLVLIPAGVLYAITYLRWPRRKPVKHQICFGREVTSKNCTRKAGK